MYIVTPEHFLDDLKVVELGGVGSRSALNGLRERDGPYASYQEYYDERYFTPDREMPPMRTASAPVTERSAPRLAPSFSTSSVHSTDSMGGGSNKLEKKRRGLGKWL